jgi:hypothetical protein
VNHDEQWLYLSPYLVLRQSRKCYLLHIILYTNKFYSAGSGYLFPAKQSPKYTMGSAGGAIFTGLYQVGLHIENKRRDRREGKPPVDCRPDTATYADDAPGFRYLE